MNPKVGLWIDHSKAVAVALTDRGEEITLAVSKIERQLRRTGDSPMKGSFEAQQVPASDTRQRALQGQLNLYYDSVIAGIRDAEAILILGLGEAKVELKGRLKKNKLDGDIVAVESADKMTEHQVAARVRKFFGQ